MDKSDIIQEHLAPVQLRTVSETEDSCSLGLDNGTEIKQQTKITNLLLLATIVTSFPLHPGLVKKTKGCKHSSNSPSGTLFTILELPVIPLVENHLFCKTPV